MKKSVWMVVAAMLAAAVPGFGQSAAEKAVKEEKLKNKLKWINLLYYFYKIVIKNK